MGSRRTEHVGLSSHSRANFAPAGGELVRPVCNLALALLTLAGVFAPRAEAQAAPSREYIYLGSRVVAIESAPSTATLSLAVSHVGNFTRGQNNAVYTITVSNTSASPTNGTVTVTETVPTGLTLVSMAGTGWNCTANTCTRGDALGTGSNYPQITVSVNVASNAPSSVTNVASVSWGGSSSATANDPTTINPAGPPVLSVASSHVATFTQGQPGAVYMVTVSNAATAGPTSGTVTMTETVPTGLTLVSMAGTGWSCATNACTRGDALGAGANYPAIIVSVNVATNAPSSVTNQASVSGGGSAAASFLDPTTIVPPSTIASLSPGSATAGGAGFTLIVTGTNFFSGFAVQWNGTSLATTWISGTQLNAAVPASLIQTPGNAAVKVLNPGGGVSTT